jgi:hypothetical protein
MSGTCWCEEFNEWLVFMGIAEPKYPHLSYLVHQKKDGTLIRILVCIDDCLYSATSDIAKGKLFFSHLLPLIQNIQIGWAI